MVESAYRILKKEGLIPFLIKSMNFLIWKVILFWSFLIEKYQYIDPNSTYVTVSLSATKPKSISITGEYAVIVGEGLSVVNISNPKNPSEVGTLPDTEIVGGYGIDINGDYAYITEYRGSNLKSVDISEPTKPSVVDTLNIITQGRKIWVDDSYALVTTDGSTDRKDPYFHSVNISDPSNLRIADTLNDPDFEYSFETAVIDDTALVCGRGQGHLIQVNVSDMTSLSKSGKFTSRNINHPYGIVIDQDNSNAFITTASDDNRVVSLDVSDPLNISQLGVHSSIQTRHCYGIDIYDDGDKIVFSARNSECVTNVDVSDPFDMNQIGYIATSGRGLGPYDSAVTGGYVFSVRRGSNKLIVSDACV
jgi:hypothetical protein